MKKIKDKYDVVIIGSGMGGLSCGMMLAMEGKSVCILEKNAQIGGTLQTFKRDGGKFDTGVHYVGGLDEGQPLYPYFKYMDIYKDIDVMKLDENAYDIITFGGDDNQYPHAQGYENFKNQLLKFFPDEEANLDRYIHDIKALCKKFALYNVYDLPEKVNELEYMYDGATQRINQYTSNPKLQQVLAGSNLLYAGEENKTPFYVHALIINSYMMSAYKFQHGGSQISRSLNYSIKDLGGTIVRNAEVTSINHNDTSVESVTLQDGRQIKGDIFISNVHPTETIKLMDQSLMRKSYTSRISGLENTVSVFTLYLVMKPKTVKYINSNFYNFREDKVWGLTDYKLEDWGKDFAVFFLPDNKNPEYTSVITVMAYMKMEEMTPWINTFNTTTQVSDRDESYQNFKEIKAQFLLEKMEGFMPGIKRHIKSYSTSTPLTQRDYLNTTEGSLYGISRDHNFPLKSQINTKTKMKNMFFTGQNIILHGVLGATISAVVTCTEILGREYLLNKIKAKL
ncbi:NAD(P)/FAD-dependent oxidoreductase [Reichenbachiella agarivorans]|uniref:NAD(P)/FAD-dependent oxidoreductase n=1 Tax=Reichenbachiella agarivorans TaxID=2979464 RepID=A0ABY6CJQ2_9BACT|nr:NAD(P)/FAD-dependent oxidoreductase [Reichenbachiella agarivorans]UXP30751.1 NAD(P)/FAD-dependent oxidoreductase [Reichenbachiella agarivorans]